MSTAILAKSNLDSQAHENILSYIDNRTYVKDPRSPNSITKNRTFVYDSDPFAKAINFSDFPYIIVNFPVITQSSQSSQGNNKRIDWSQRILVRAARDGSVNTRNDVGRNDMMAISNDLFELFNNMTVKKELIPLNINDLSFKKTDADIMAIQQKEVYEWEYSLEYYSRMTTN